MLSFLRHLPQAHVSPTTSEAVNGAVCSSTGLLAFNHREHSVLHEKTLKLSLHMICALYRLATKAAAIFQRAAAWLDEVAAPASFKQRACAMMCYQFIRKQCRD